MKRHRIDPGSSWSLADHDPDDTGDFETDEDGKAAAKAKTEKLVSQMDRLQVRLFSNRTRALLIVLQGMDTSGKDSTIRHVMSGMNPQGCRVAAFKAPTTDERAHDFLWRIHREVPAKGYIGIFNRSHYEDVLVTRVNGWISPKAARRRFDQINEFEELLTDNGTTILKFFLHISKEEQKKRLEDRIRDPEKRWKWDSEDLEQRKRWPDYMKAFEEAISATSTTLAPWYVVPANRKWYRNIVVADRTVGALEKMNLTMAPGPQGVDFKKLKVV